MTPLAQSDMKHGQEIVSSKLEPVETPVDHVECVEQGNMALPKAISTDQLIDPNMSLDPKFLLFPLKILLAQIQLKLLICKNENCDTSLVLPSTENNTNSLMETEEFFRFYG